MAIEEDGIVNVIIFKLNEIKEVLKTRKWQMVIGVILILFIIIAVYIYKGKVKPILNPDFVDNKEYVNGKYSENINLMFFYTDWCPHCKMARPIWDEFKESQIFSNGTYNGTPISFNEINCDENTSMADEYNVKAYPTIKLAYGNKIIEYDAKPNIETLTTFLNTSV